MSDNRSPAAPPLSSTVASVDASGADAELGELVELRQSQSRRWPRAVAAFVCGLVLLAFAIRVTVREGATLRHGLEAIAAASPWMLVLALTLPLVNLVLASGSFWVLTNRYGRVRYAEMTGLIASAWLLNHLPLRPGMVGRVAYHKLVHGIPVRSSLAVLLAALICAAIGMGTLLVLAVALHAAGATEAVTIGVLALPPVVAAAAAGVLRLRRDDPRQLWRYPAAVAFRYLDVCCWTARYALVFAVLGRPITTPAAAAIALSGQAAMLSPVQLGLREWMVSVAASVIPGATAQPALPTTAEALAPGLLIDLINRAAELSVAIPVGTVATLVLLARFRRVRKAPPMIGQES